MSVGSKAARMVAIAVTMLPTSGFADSLRIYAAGSLTGAFRDMLKEFAAPPDAVAAPLFGPSGLLREKIEAGVLGSATGLHG